MSTFGINKGFEKKNIRENFGGKQKQPIVGRLFLVITLLVLNTRKYPHSSILLTVILYIRGTMKYFFIFVLIFLTSGCTHLYKHYDFSENEVRVAGGKLRVELVGAWRQVSRSPEITKKENPYYIDMDFIIKDTPGKECKIYIDQLVFESGKVVDFELEELITTKRWGIEILSRSVAHARFLDITLDEYAPVVLKARLTYENKVYPIEMKFRTKYIEIHGNNTIDAYMGI